MEPFGIDSFKHVKTPHTLKVGRTGRLAFIIRQADMKNNRYRSDIYTLRGKRAQQVTSCGDVSNFWWLDKDTLIFTRTAGKPKKAGRSGESAGRLSTSLYRVSAKTPDKPQNYIDLP